jgi:hypothetical protein
MQSKKGGVDRIAYSPLFIFFPESLFYEGVIGIGESASDVFDHLGVPTRVNTRFFWVKSEFGNVVFNQSVNSTFCPNPWLIPRFCGSGN